MSEPTLYLEFELEGVNMKKRKIINIEKQAENVLKNEILSKYSGFPGFLTSLMRSFIPFTGQMDDPDL